MIFAIMKGLYQIGGNGGNQGIKFYYGNYKGYLWNYISVLVRCYTS